MTRIDDYQAIFGSGHSRLRGMGINLKGDMIPGDVLNDVGNDRFDRAGGEKKKSGFSIFNAAEKFFKGAVIDTVKGIFSFKGLLAMGATYGAVALLGTGVLPVLLGAGAVMGGLQLAKGIGTAINRYSQGDGKGAENAFEEIGSGAAATGLSLFGLKKLYSTGGLKTTFTDAEGVTTTSQEASKTWSGALRQLGRDIMGKTKVDGTDKSIWGNISDTGKTNLNSAWTSLKGYKARFFPAKPTAPEPVNTLTGEVRQPVSGSVAAAEAEAGGGNTATLTEQITSQARNLGKQAQTQFTAVVDQAKKLGFAGIRDTVVARGRQGYNWARQGITNFETKNPGTLPLALAEVNRKGLGISQEEEDSDSFSYS